ncbi:MAG: hypothetical protein K1X88_30085 [Nannocystaceae bacterium]|nr:hypothetical protein [Nannocystaceae bacterium]
MTRTLAITTLLAAACGAEPAAAPSPELATPATVVLDERDQYALLADIETTVGTSLLRDGEAMARVRASWQGQRVRWELAYVPLFCREASACHLAPFDHARFGTRRIQQGWMPQLELDAAGRDALAAACAGQPACVVRLEATVRQFTFDPEHATALRLSDVALLGARAARPDESWLASPPGTRPRA